LGFSTDLAGRLRQGLFVLLPGLAEKKIPEKRSQIDKFSPKITICRANREKTPYGL